MISRQYTRKIQIFKTTDVSDGYGGNTVEDVLIGAYWAEVSQNSAFKDNSLGKADIKKNYSFKIRSNDNITPDIDNLSVIYKGSKYVVNDIRYNDELFREINITANGISGSIGSDSPPGCVKPVVTEIPPFQFSERYIQRGVTTYLQIQATNKPTEYAISISGGADPITQGLSVDENGLITINYTGDSDVFLLGYSATNACGTASKTIFLRMTDNDVNLLIPPTNLTPISYNIPYGPSVVIQANYLPYFGVILKVEYWKDNVLYMTFADQNIGNLVGDVQHFIQGLEYGVAYDFKVRVMNNLGQYSLFSEELTVTIPF